MGKDEMVLARWERENERRRAKATASKEMFKKTLSSQFSDTDQKRELAKELLAARNEGSAGEQRMKEAMKEWGGEVGEEFTGYDELSGLPWNRE